MSDLSRVKNAARDMARDMARFERDFARYQREAKAAIAAGASNGEITRATNEAVAGHPDLQRKLNQLSDGLASQTVTSDA